MESLFFVCFLFFWVLFFLFFSVSMLEPPAGGSNCSAEVLLWHKQSGFVEAATQVGLFFFFFNLSVSFTGCADLNSLDSMSPQEKKRQGYIHELIETEERYVEDLNVVLEVISHTVLLMTQVSFKCSYTLWQNAYCFIMMRCVRVYMYSVCTTIFFSVFLSWRVCVCLGFPQAYVRVRAAD